MYGGRGPGLRLEELPRNLSAVMIPSSVFSLSQGSDESFREQLERSLRWAAAHLARRLDETSPTFVASEAFALRLLALALKLESWSSSRRLVTDLGRARPSPPPTCRAPA